MSWHAHSSAEPDVAGIIGKECIPASRRLLGHFVVWPRAAGVHAWDGTCRLTGVANPQGERTTWAYDSVSRLSTLTYANTATVTYAYDAASRTTGVRNAKSDGTAIAGFVYTLDDAGNPTGMVLSNGDRVTWTYDSLNRLTREQRDGANAYDITYTYDSTSNRLTKLASGTTRTYSYDNADALLTENAGGTLTTYTWDDSGNNTLVQAAGGVTTMAWDGEDRLSAIQLPGASVVTNTYGFDGLRRKREDAGTTKYLSDDQRLLLESDGSDVTQALYTSSLGAYGNVVSQRRSSTSNYLHPDHLGTIWSVTGADQATSDTYLFDAWGKQLASSGSTANPHRYVGALGYYTEPSLSLDYVRARWLRPSTGSWLSVDPLLRHTAMRYVGARPTARRDPSGLQALMPCAFCWLFTPTATSVGSFGPGKPLPPLLYGAGPGESCGDVISSAGGWGWLSGVPVIWTQPKGGTLMLFYLVRGPYGPPPCGTGGGGTGGGRTGGGGTGGGGTAGGGGWPPGGGTGGGGTGPTIPGGGEPPAWWVPPGSPDPRGPGTEWSPGYPWKPVPVEFFPKTPCGKKPERIFCCYSTNITCNTWCERFATLHGMDEADCMCKCTSAYEKCLETGFFGPIIIYTPM